MIFMTRQITIKLNEEKFQPLISDLKTYGHNMMATNSALAGFAIWFLHMHCFEVDPELGMTRADFIFKARDNPKEQVMFETIGMYKQFLKPGTVTKD